MRLSTFVGLGLVTVCGVPMAASAALVSPPLAGTIVFPPGGTSATLNGALPNQGTPLELTVTLPYAASLSAFTTSYASGGFEPNLSIYNSSGTFLTGESYPGLGSTAHNDPSTGLALDGSFTAANLPAGTYTITLTDFELQQDPSATNLSDGFTFNIGDGTNFVDEQGNTRTGAYSLTVALTPVPEPTAVAGTLLAGLGLLRRRRV